MRKKLLVAALAALLPITVLAAKTAPAEQPLIIQVPHTFLGSDLAIWDAIDQVLYRDSTQHVIFLWSGIGGDVLAGQQFINAMQFAQSEGKTIDIEVTGNSYSMHALPLCYANHVDIPDGTTIMFHHMSSETAISLLFTELYFKSYAVGPDAQLQSDEEFGQCVKAGYLTQDEVNDINTNHTEYYMMRIGGHDYMKSKPADNSDTIHIGNPDQQKQQQKLED